MARQQLPSAPWLLLLLLALLLCSLPALRAFDGTDLGATLTKEVDHAACVRLFHSKGSTGCRTTSHDGESLVSRGPDGTRSRLKHPIGSINPSTTERTGTTVPLYYLGGFSTADQQAFQVRACVRACSSSSDNGTKLCVCVRARARIITHPSCLHKQTLSTPVGVVVPASLLNGSVLEYLAAHAPRLTAGVIVLEDEAEPEEDARLAAGAFSPDVTTPQGLGTPSMALTIGPAHPWNPQGTGIALQEYAFPVVLATGTLGTRLIIATAAHCTAS